jgi:hypothetical protein
MSRRAFNQFHKKYVISFINYVLYLFVVIWEVQNASFSKWDMIASLEGTSSIQECNHMHNIELYSMC